MLRLTQVLTSGALACCTASVLAQDGPAFDRAAVQAGLEAVSSRSVPAAMLVVVRGEEVLFAMADGVASIKDKTDASPTTLFALGELSRIIPSFAVTALLGDDALGFEDSVNALLEPALRARNPDGTEHEFTVAQLIRGDVAFPSFWLCLSQADAQSWTLDRVLGEHAWVYPDRRQAALQSQIADAMLQAVLRAKVGPWAEVGPEFARRALRLDRVVTDTKDTRPEGGVVRYTPGLLGLPTVVSRTHPVVAAATGGWIDTRDASRLLQLLVKMTQTEKARMPGVEEAGRRSVFRGFSAAEKPAPCLRMESDPEVAPGLRGVVELFPEQRIGWMLLTNSDAEQPAQAALLELLAQTLLGVEPAASKRGANTGMWNTAVGLGGSPRDPGGPKPGLDGRWVAAIKVAGEPVELAIEIAEDSLVAVQCGDERRTPDFEFVRAKALRATCRSPIPGYAAAAFKCTVFARYEPGVTVIRGEIRLSGEHGEVVYAASFERDE